MTLLLLQAVEENMCLHEEMKSICSVVFPKMRNLSFKQEVSFRLHSIALNGFICLFIFYVIYSVAYLGAGERRRMVCLSVFLWSLLFIISHFFFTRTLDKQGKSLNTYWCYDTATNKILRIHSDMETILQNMVAYINKTIRIPGGISKHWASID